MKKFYLQNFKWTTRIMFRSSIIIYFTSNSPINITYRILIMEEDRFHLPMGMNYHLEVLQVHLLHLQVLRLLHLQRKLMPYLEENKWWTSKITNFGVSYFQQLWTDTGIFDFVVFNLSRYNIYCDNKFLFEQHSRLSVKIFFNRRSNKKNFFHQ